MSRRLPAFCFLMLALHACNDNLQIDKGLVCSTLNEIIQQDSIFARIICHKFDRTDIPKEIQKEFFPGDEGFIHEQLKNNVNAFVDTGKLYFYWRRKKGLEESFIDTTCSKNIFYRFSYPIFSKDLQTVIVGITEDCNGILCGWGFKAVYRRQNNKWVKVKEYDAWIS
jgi:hypothetical protein